MKSKVCVKTSHCRRLLFLYTAALAVSLGIMQPAALSADSMPRLPSKELPLGGDGLQESRTQTMLAPGVSLTTITRGIVSKHEHWTLQVMMSSSGGASSILASRDLAQQTAERLKEKGFRPELREERNLRYCDLPAATIGYGIRVGSYVSREDAGTDISALSALGYKTMPVFTGEDGDPTSGPWSVRVLTIDPRFYHGEIFATHGESIAARRKTSELARQTAGLAAINGGFFVMSPADGVVGEPAGLFIDHGKILSEATNGRIAMSLFNRNAPDGDTRVRFQRLITTLNLRVGKELFHRIEGINRNPGRIRNCGGIGDAPTDLPMHDRTCTDADELVVITPEFGAPAPSGDGIEVVVNRNGTVTELRGRTGGAVPDGGMLVQGIGDEAAWLTSNIHIGDTLQLKIDVTDASGQKVEFDANDSAVNGGPGLIADGHQKICPAADGLIHPDDPSFFLRWGVRRNPRTLAGVDKQNRILLVTVDGHQPGYSLGLSLVEAARLMAALGAVNAMNLDGGGSTAMAINGKLVSAPSDPMGERAVGDAVIVK